MAASPQTAASPFPTGKKKKRGAFTYHFLKESILKKVRKALSLSIKSFFKSYVTKELG